MNISSLVFMCLGASLIVTPVTGGAKEKHARTEDSWHDVTDDVSPHDQFKHYVFALQATPGVVLPFGLQSIFSFPAAVTTDINGKPRTLPVVFGIDISHYDGPDFPFEALEDAKVSYIYMKATQGTTAKDGQFAHYIDRINEVEQSKHVTIVHGPYHFLSSDPKQSGKAQADAYVDYVELHGGFNKGDLPPAVDLEWDVACGGCPDRWLDNKRTPDQIIQTTLDFVNEVSARTHYSPLIYTNRTFLDHVKIMSPNDVARLAVNSRYWIFDLDSADRKIEHPNDANNLPHLLWQFSFTGRLSNSFSDKDIDTDVFQGTPEQFADTVLNK
jgi:lysozyme